jgi:Domain of unknown function (DUF4160)
MPVIYRKDGCRFVIYLNDHGPAHVHIIGDGEAKIALEPNVRLMDKRLWEKRCPKSSGCCKRSTNGIFGTMGNGPW